MSRAAAPFPIQILPAATNGRMLSRYWGAFKLIAVPRVHRGAGDRTFRYASAYDARESTRRGLHRVFSQ